MKVAIIKYNAGNVQSVIHALDRLGVESILTDNIEEVKSADKVVFPGQGEASTAMRHLRNKGLDEVIKNLQQPVLGVCIGLQLLCEYSEEGNTSCLGVFPLNVKKFVDPTKSFKIPHMGWNNLYETKGPLFEGLLNPYVYYVHSYYAEIGQDNIAKTDYAQSFSAALQKENFYAIQAHPEKSGKDGERILQNFLDIK